MLRVQLSALFRTPEYWGPKARYIPEKRTVRKIMVSMVKVIDPSGPAVLRDNRIH